MAEAVQQLDLARLTLSAGEGRRLDLEVDIEPLVLGEQHYAPSGSVAVRLDISCTTSGYALRLRSRAPLEGPCMRCLERAGRTVPVDAREVDQPGGGEDLSSPYVDGDDDLDLAAWARDAFALAVPAQITCMADCRGLCPTCGANLNDDPEHAHEAEPDQRWAKLSEIRFD